MCVDKSKGVCGGEIPQFPYLCVCHGGRSHRWGTAGSPVPCAASWLAAHHAHTGGGRRTGTVGGTQRR